MTNLEIGIGEVFGSPEDFVIQSTIEFIRDSIASIGDYLYKLVEPLAGMESANFSGAPKCSSLSPVQNQFGNSIKKF